ncbi:hypothetical protein NVP1127O_60 [Vibrio phage 1.127.O._10N.286.52.E12]|nr:hypothetical protein NVP1127O_60 [Vibrio phage 1.127.O._10N.286.52.E12]
MPKIIQLLPLQNDATYQGALWGLGDDGVVYEYSREAWRKIIPSHFVCDEPEQADTTKTVTRT